jgi:hypothetical protein
LPRRRLVAVADCFNLVLHGMREAPMADVRVEGVETHDRLIEVLRANRDAEELEVEVDAAAAPLWIRAVGHAIEWLDEEDADLHTPLTLPELRQLRSDLAELFAAAE